MPTLEAHIYTALKPLVDGEVYRDKAKLGVTALPRITFQQVGGEPTNFLDSETIPSQKNARVQVNCWDDDRDDVAALSRLVEDTLRAYLALQTTVLGEPVATVEEDSEPVLYGTLQDFSFWHST